MNKKASLETGQNLLHETGFGEFWAELFQPGSPLAFLTAQALRVAEPVLGAFTTPTALANLEQLAGRLESAAKPTDPNSETSDS